MIKIKNLNVKTFLVKILFTILVLLTLSVVILNQQIPAFIYNEIELWQRADYIFTEEARDKVNYLIDIRNGETDVLASDQDKRDLPDTIDKGLEHIDNFLENYQELMGQQDKILLLPKKYKQYQEFKKTAFVDYRRSQEIFREVKAIEHRVVRVMTQFDETTRNVFSYNPDLKAAAGISKITAEEMDKLYHDNKISAEFNDYVYQRTKNFIDLYDLEDDNLTQSQMDKEVRRILSRGAEADTTAIITSWHEQILDPMNEQVNQTGQTALDKMYEADRYYRENNLGNDTISWLLSKISNKFPKNF